MPLQLSTTGGLSMPLQLALLLLCGFATATEFEVQPARVMREPVYSTRVKLQKFVDPGALLFREEVRVRQCMSAC
jgi:hypothetical protein